MAWVGMPACPRIAKSQGATREMLRGEEPTARLRFIEDCMAALRDSEPRAAVAALLRGAIEDPAIGAIAGSPQHDDDLAGRIWYRSPRLSVLQTVFRAGVHGPPHEHGAWCAVALFAGREEHFLYEDSSDGLRDKELRGLAAGGLILLDETAIHSVRNPGDIAARGLHVYGADLFDLAAHPRRMWSPSSRLALPYDFDQFAAWEEESLR